MLRIVLLAVLAFASGCTTLGNMQFGNVLTAACSQRATYIAPVQLLADAGELSPKNLDRFEKVKVSVETLCLNPPQDVASAALTVTSLYLTLRNIRKE